ncbi:MAG: MotA/TolQ/ExbB proton channel family protein [Proteobacteria bacterium]|nr:MotA/TolQ/ExbB proton channel family protein [Pseudomonadota bacterium]
MKTAYLTLGFVLAFTSVGLAEEAKKTKPSNAASLDDLLDKIKAGWRQETAEQREREEQFIANKEKQQQLLKEAEAALEAEQKRSEQLEQEFDQNKVRVDELEITLKERLGTMGELFGVIRQVVGDTRSQVDHSIVSAQFPNRGDSLEKLASSKGLPKIEQLEQLWYVLQHEMTESGKVSRFSAPVVSAQGEEKKQKVTRVGVFNAVSNGKFLYWLPKPQKLAELGRQPPTRYLKTARDLEEAKTGFVDVAVDPSRGVILSLIVQTPGNRERIDQGGPIGYTVIFLGIITFVIAVLRFLYLAFVSWKVRRQRSSSTVRTNNPLGRIMNVYEQNPSAKTETLELKLDEAILRESTKLDRLLWLVKIVSVVAPLLGLLGTVTGMIKTFQALTLFGTGDPKLMAGGISEALVTTMLGLCVAIPLVLLHSGLKSMSKRISDELEEQSAGIIAKRAEQTR